MNTLGQIIRQARLQRGWRQGDLARQLGVSRQTVVAIESDHHVPTFDTAIRLADLLGLPLEMLANARRDPLTTPVQLFWMSEVTPHVPLPVIWSSVHGKRVLVPVSLLATTSAPDAIFYPDENTVVPLPLARDPDTVVLLGGCDPFMPWLSHIFQRRTDQFTLESMWLSSTEALTRWREDWIHIAGVHLFDPERGVYNPTDWAGGEHLKLPYLTWEEGLVTRPDHRPWRRLAIREPGSEAHALFLRHGPKSLDTEVFRTHRALLDAVAQHQDWAGVGLGPQAVLMGLEFTPWVKEQYDLFIRSADQKAPWFPVFLETLASRELIQRLDAVPHLARK